MRVRRTPSGGLRAAHRRPPRSAPRLPACHRSSRRRCLAQALSLRARPTHIRPLRGRVEQAELRRLLDRVAAAGDAELPVGRDRLGLHGVPRDVEALADLAEGEVGREEREQSELRGREPGRPAPWTPGMASTWRRSSAAWAAGRRAGAGGRRSRRSRPAACAPRPGRGAPRTPRASSSRVTTASHGIAWVRAGIESSARARFERAWSQRPWRRSERAKVASSSAASSSPRREPPRPPRAPRAPVAPPRAGRRVPRRGRRARRARGSASPGRRRPRRLGGPGQASPCSSSPSRTWAAPLSRCAVATQALSSGSSPRAASAAASILSAPSRRSAARSRLIAGATAAPSGALAAPRSAAARACSASAARPRSASTQPRSTATDGNRSSRSPSPNRSSQASTVASRPPW